MAQPASNPKIEELRFRLKTDPKSRLFFPLAEELRKIDQLGAAEQILRSGLANHPTYLSAWVSLGRVLREQDKHGDAVEALSKALQIDAGNVVAARLLADSYLDLGDKLESIKKYKLVRALVPPDEELDAIIERLEDELNPVTIVGDSTMPAPASPPDEAAPPAAVPEESPFASEEEQVFADAAASRSEEQRVEEATGDVEPMHAAHEESPFEEPAPSYNAAAVEVEQPQGMHVEPAPLVAEVPTPWMEEETASEVFSPTAAPPPPADDLGNTMTMADLYIRQGFTDKAREIYQNILQRDPENREVREKLDALQQPASMAKADKLARWLAKVKKEEGRVV
jgi:tetratricopeptide (TPR) repeat protein